MASRGRVKVAEKENGQKPVAKQVFFSDEHKQMTQSEEKRSKGFLIIASLFFLIVFVMLAMPNVSLEVDLGEQGAMLGDVEKGLSMNGFNVFNAFEYRNKDTFDYIVGNIEALQKAINLGQKDLIYSAVTQAQRTLLDFAFMSIGIVSLIVLAGSATFIVLGFVGYFKKKFSRKVPYMMLFITTFFVFVNFVITAVMQSESTSEIIISIGVGVWVNLIVCLSFCAYAIFDIVKMSRLDNLNKQLAKKGSTAKRV